MYYFNTMGVVGWYFSGNVLKNGAISPTASRWFDRLVPLLDYLDRITFNRFGLSSLPPKKVDMRRAVRVVLAQ
jgi:hypothetical protein